MTGSLDLRQEQTLEVLENRVLRRIFGHKEEEIGEGCNYLMRNFVTFYLCLYTLFSQGT